MASLITALGLLAEGGDAPGPGIPFSDVNLRTHKVHQPPWTQFSSLSEVSTLSLEFTYLERAAGCAPQPPIILCLFQVCRVTLLSQGSHQNDVTPNPCVTRTTISHGRS